MACIAGATATPAYLKTNPKYGFLKPLVMKPEAVSEIALKKLGKKALFIPGFSNRMNYFILTRLLPRKTAAAIANKTMFGMFQHQI
jgi:short-subunit dehydrogenase